MTGTVRIVACPTCGQSVEWNAENAFRPFCSKRCKLIDLGEWASEGYRVPEDGTPSVDLSDLSDPA